IHSFLFHRIEGLFTCCLINRFATDDDCGEDAFGGCSIKLSGDNDISRREATSLCGFADIPTLRLIWGGVGWVGGEKAKFCHFPRHFQEQLNALGPDFQSRIKDHSGVISVRPRQATRIPNRDRISRYTDHRNAGVQRHDLFNEYTRERVNNIGAACDDLAREASDAVRLAEGRIPLHDQILSFDVAEPVQLLKKYLKRPIATIWHQLLEWSGGMENGQPLYAS